MPNTQTSVPAFTAGQVLTAAQMTEVNTGIPVFATTTTRDAAFGGTGEKTLAEGQFAYIEATNTTQYYDGSAWQPVGASGLTLVKTQTIGSAVSSVTVTNAFSTTYENYKIFISGGVGSTELQLNMTLGASATQYYVGGIYTAYSTGNVGGLGGDNITSWTRAGWANAAPGQVTMNMELIGPYLAVATSATALWSRSGVNLGVVSFYHNVATSYTDFTLTCSTGNITGGTIYVYGYAKS